MITTSSKSTKIFSCALQSGSNGNCFYVETPDTRLLIDAGISAKTARDRLSRHKRRIEDVDALLITHNHADHVRHAGVYQRKFSLPIYISTGSWKVSQSILGRINDINQFVPGQTFDFSQTTVRSVPTAHDGHQGAAFIITYDKRSLGIFTDLGHRFSGLDDYIQDLDGLYLESNYDPEMLENGPYPNWLKQRIRGKGGHLSNLEAAQLVRDTKPRLQWLVLSHLSEHNNQPGIALATAEDILGDYYSIRLAKRTDTTDMMIIS